MLQDGKTLYAGGSLGKACAKLFFPPRAESSSGTHSFKKFSQVRGASSVNKSMTMSPASPSSSKTDMAAGMEWLTRVCCCRMW